MTGKQGATKQGATRITDVKLLGVVSHPVRRRILAILLLDGPATVGMLAERTGQAIGSISHHLKTLAGAELIEEVPELAKDKRERWWRRSTGSIQWHIGELQADDPTTEMITSSALAMNVDYQLAQLRAFHARILDEQETWPNGPFSTDSWIRFTDEELCQFRTELIELMDKWKERPLPDDGQERRPVFVFAHGVPGEP